MVGVPALNVDSWALGNNRELLDKYRVDAEAPPQGGEDDNEEDEEEPAGKALMDDGHSDHYTSCMQYHDLASG